MLRRIWITPPLGIARVGSAPTPCQAFSWAQAPVAPGTSGMTTLMPEDTLELDEDGAVTVVPARTRTRIAFKDEQGRFHPVCPFFELHGEWVEGGEVRTGPVTEDILTRFGPPIDGRAPRLCDVVWDVVVANLKAHH
ncbi:MAG TPA: hypothetical protein VK943_08585, partial [Arenibaculum sp.]|nr:hypothetical protein [Arenibaculum sp.]